MDYAKLAQMLPDEADGWAFKLKDDGSFSFNCHSPAGEDLWIECECTSPEYALEEIKTRVKYENESFDADEHIDLWAQVRGTRGAPDSYEVLTEDAKAIGEMLKGLSDAVSEWEVPEETDCTDCPVCGHKNIERSFETNLSAGVAKGVYRCPQCFFASTREGINMFWGFSEKKRTEQRKGIIEEYVRYLDTLYERSRS